MDNRPPLSWVVILLCIVASSPVYMLPQSTHENEDSSCRSFTQQFYDWYAPLTQDLSLKAVLAAQRKIREREPEVLSPRLLRALRVDNEAQERVKGELLGLDFDPFVGSQDPADHYEARKLHLENNQCSVEVWRASRNDNAAKSDKPDVVVVLAQQSGRWRFVNFKYPQLNSDLLSALAELAKERSKPPK